MAAHKEPLPAGDSPARDASTQTLPEPEDTVIWWELSAALQTLSAVDPGAWESEGMVMFRQVFADLRVELARDIEDMVETVRGG